MPKILCLPGYLQSGKVFAEKSSGIRKLLTKKLGYQLDYVDPPTMITSKEDLPFKLADSDEEATAKWTAIVDQDINRCWWHHKETGSYEGFDTSVKFIANYIKENGPYDGIIGFSQGAAMAAMVTNSVGKIVPDHPDFKIAVFFSGFVFTQPLNPSDLMVNLNINEENVDEYAKKVEVVPEFVEMFTFPPNCTTKVVNIYGANDNTVPGVRSQYLSQKYPAEVLTEISHDGGHFLPNKKPFLNPIVDIFKSAIDTSNL